MSTTMFATMSATILLSDDINNKIIFNTVTPVSNYLCVLNKYKKRKTIIDINLHTHTHYILMQTYLINTNTILQLLKCAWIKWCPDTHPLKLTIINCKESNPIQTCNLNINRLIRAFNNIQDNLALLKCDVITNSSIDSSIDSSINNNIDFIKALDCVQPLNYNIFAQLNVGFKVQTIHYSPFVFHMLLLYILDNSNNIFTCLNNLINLITCETDWNQHIIPICTLPLNMGYFIVISWDIDNGKYYAFLLGGSDGNEALYNQRAMVEYIASMRNACNLHTKYNSHNTKVSSTLNKIQINDKNIIKVIKKLKTIEPSDFNLLMNVK
uniref:Uncharacterized protein n=1 Tax=viral metagenome TaxID=1070528 RepID=A0A6C0HME3_9ZZZZ